METILITGINGYLGSNLAKRYSKKYQIVGLEYDIDNLFRLKDDEYQVYSSKDGIPDILFHENKIDYIIHTATFYGRNKESDSQMIYTNTYLPQLLLQKAISNGSSLFINTDTILDRFTSSYALTKRQFFDWIFYYSKKSNIKIINLRLEHFYGPGTSETNFVTLMIKKMLNNETNISLTQGEQMRNFLFIEDLMKVYDLILEKNKNFEAFSDFEVGSANNTRIRDLLEMIKTLTNSNSNLEYGKLAYRKNELMISSIDIGFLKELGWKPSVTLRDGLLRVIRYEKDIKSDLNNNHK